MRERTDAIAACLGITRARAISLALAVASAIALPTAAVAGPAARIADPPLGLPPIPGVSDAPPSAAEIALGRKLFFDPRLSRDGGFSCASCHIPEQAFATTGQTAPLGRDGRPLRRNAPGLLNVAYARALFVDGRAPTLERQVLGPLLAPQEMGNRSAEEVVARLRTFDDYAGLFERAFGAPPDVKTMTRAIASYERSLLSANSPFDRWRFGGDEGAVSEAAKRGFRLFTKEARCAECHKIGETAALFTDHKFHFIGTGFQPQQARALKARARFESDPRGHLRLAALAGDPDHERGPPVDLGRQEVTGDPEDQWVYRTPSLRNVALTAPYMHDGSMQSLEEVLRYYNYPNVWHVRLDHRIGPLGLAEAQLEDLVAFLESLTGDNLDVLVQEAREDPARN